MVLGAGDPASVPPAGLTSGEVAASRGLVSTRIGYRQAVPILRGMSRSALLLRLALFGVASGIAFLVIRPVHAGQVGFDVAASVLYFDRIVAGRHLEAFISATPKPLFTAVYGLIHALTADWRPISWIAIAVYGLAVVAATELAWRLAGLAAAGFAAVGCLGSYILLEDASAAYAVGPAFLAWTTAGLLVTSSRPRYALAGVALLLAGLLRFETLILDALIAAVLIGLTLAGRRRPALAPPRDAWWLLLAFLALPIQMVHDFLLTGDPFWSESVPARASQGIAVMTSIETIRWIASHYVGIAPLVLLALVGVVALVVSRRWAILVGLVALGPGILAFLVFLAARGVFLSERYLSPPDLAVLFTAAVGVGSLRIPSVRDALLAVRDTGRRTLALGLASVALGGLAALALVRPFAPLDRALAQKIDGNLAMFIHLGSAEPDIQHALGAIPGARDVTAPPGSPDGGTLLLVPVLLRPRMAVDLAVPLTRIAGTNGPAITTTGAYPAPGQLVYHDRLGDAPASAFHVLEVSAPTDVGAIHLDPLLADPSSGVWLVSVRAR